MSKILIIDDEPQIRRFLRISLNASGYETIEADAGRRGVAAAQEQRPDLIVLDLGLPDIDGLEAVTLLQEVCAAPIVVLSVRAQECDKVEALDRGAVDYVVKPFGVGELTARIRAALRRPVSNETTGNQTAGNLTLENGSPENEPAPVRAGRVTVDAARRLVTRDDAPVRLSRREYDLLAFLAARADRVATHRDILRAVWGPAHDDDAVYLRIYVKQLRRKLETDPNRPALIVTEPGVGYRFRTAPD